MPTPPPLPGSIPPPPTGYHGYTYPQPTSGIHKPKLPVAYKILYTLLGGLAFVFLLFTYEIYNCSILDTTGGCSYWGGEPFIDGNTNTYAIVACAAAILCYFAGTILAWCGKRISAIFPLICFVLVFVYLIGTDNYYDYNGYWYEDGFGFHEDVFRDFNVEWISPCVIGFVICSLFWNLSNLIFILTRRK